MSSAGTPDADTPRDPFDPRIRPDPASNPFRSASETDTTTASDMTGTSRTPSAPAPSTRSAANESAAPPSRAIARRDFEQVIRRAAELSLSDTAPDDDLSEDEVLRIATELGLQPQYVKRALAEIPEMAVRPRWYDRQYGPAILSVSRVVPGDVPVTLRRLEDYLVTREYLQIVRRRRNSIALVPADDTISSVARAFTKSGNRHHIARASRVGVGVEPLAQEKAHVRFEVDLSEARQKSVRTALGVSTIVGLFSGSILAGITVGLAPEALGVAPHIAGFAAGLGGTIAAGFHVAARGFRERVDAARLELSGLLDRVEHGEKLEPPPAPWRRKLFGDR